MTKNKTDLIESSLKNSGIAKKNSLTLCWQHFWWHVGHQTNGMLIDAKTRDLLWKRKKRKTCFRRFFLSLSSQLRKVTKRFMSVISAASHIATKKERRRVLGNENVCPTGCSKIIHCSFDCSFYSKDVCIPCETMTQYKWGRRETKTLFGTIKGSRRTQKNALEGKKLQVFNKNLWSNTILSDWMPQGICREEET